LRRDLVLALVGAIGTDLDHISKRLSSAIAAYGYGYFPIQVSALFKRITKFENVDRKHFKHRLYEYYDKAIKAGDEIREKGGNSAVAELVIAEIHETRKTESLQPRAFVVRSLKRPEEIKTLREVYGSLFYCLSVYADEHARENSLAREFLAPGKKTIRSQSLARELIELDAKENLKHGQNTRDAFAEADYFLRTDSGDEADKAIKRFVELVFGEPYLSPTRSEVAMMHARSAALRSADLSRQIGAVIVARDGRILTTGCNEVPRAGGGQYWCDSDDDRRDFQVGYDVNDRRKREAIVELLENLNDQFDNGKMPFTSGEYDAGKHYDKLLEQEKKQGATRFSGTRVDSMIEYGRALHAEMSAITNAALSTISIHDCDLYSLTFPCHLCARFILGAGIRNVFYIEPYPKSAVPELYSESIVIDPALSPEEYKDRVTGSAPLVHKVFFIPFEGVAPRRYPDLFSFEPKTRKNDDGSIVEINPMKATPRQAPQLCDPTREAERAVVPKFKELIAQMNAPEEQPEVANGASA
jgi:deoxycytidylate deaminase